MPVLISRAGVETPGYDIVGEQYSEKQIIRKLQERYGASVVVTAVAGGKTVVCFKGVATRILTDKWYADRKADHRAERLRVVKAAAAVVRQDIRGAASDTEVYPHVEQIRQGGGSQLPETVRLLVDEIVGGKGAASARRAEYEQQCLVAAARPRSYVSPLRLFSKVQQWLGRDLDATQWGWKAEGLVLRAIPSLEPPAPSQLLVLVLCGCRTT